MALKRIQLNQAADCAQRLKVLADPTRLAVVELLMKGPAHVGDLVRQLKTEQSLLSHHLQTLRRSGLVQSTRDGKAVLYSLSAEASSSVGRKGIDLGCCELLFEK